MEISHIGSAFKGWFVGEFAEGICKTNKTEVAFKSYFAGESEKKHFHKLSKEITLIVSGSVRMNGIDYMAGTIISLNENEATDFIALTNCQTVVVRIPILEQSMLGDKHFEEIKET